MPFDLSPGREREPKPVSREIESARSANVIDPQQVVVKGLDNALHVGANRSELVHVGVGEHRQGLRGVVPPDRGLQRVLGSEIAIVGDEDELLGLTDAPDLQVDRGSREPDVLEAMQYKAEDLPELGPDICLHASHQRFHLPWTLASAMSPFAVGLPAPSSEEIS